MAVEFIIYYTRHVGYVSSCINIVLYKCVYITEWINILVLYIIECINILVLISHHQNKKPHYRDTDHGFKTEQNECPNATMVSPKSHHSLPRACQETHKQKLPHIFLFYTNQSHIHQEKNHRQVLSLH